MVWFGWCLLCALLVRLRLSGSLTSSFADWVCFVGLAVRCIFLSYRFCIYCGYYFGFTWVGVRVLGCFYLLIALVGWLCLLVDLHVG